MSIEAIERYHRKIETVVRYGGSRNESTLRSAFMGLLETYCANTSLQLIPELEYRTIRGTVRPDGTLKDALRMDWGYWESKDQYDSLDEEIAKKLEKGYPTTNILFEDGQTAVLIQNAIEVQRACLDDALALHALLTTFVTYEPAPVQSFREAIDRFRQDLPELLESLRALIAEQAESNASFRQARADFLELCKESINPHVVMDDVREMIIQHVLTEDIFLTVFSDVQFLRENSVARELQRVIDTFFVGDVRRNITRRMDAFSQVIKAAAAGIADHHEKQRFLKVLYENFYKAYSPEKADRLGIVYTPEEIVRFMIASADHLVHKHFGRFLQDADVEILDPATGTGTFITELIEYLPTHALPQKYAEEIHCNEVAILPYYVASLNIEYTYAQKMGQYVEFPNICFVDTLDNMGFLYPNKQLAMFGISAENLQRIRRQNERKISVIIGNPPYNANQLNENDNNKNREYPEVDKRIKATYVKESTAQKTKLYDMYTRFIRWASDRLADNGVLVFVSNNSFLEARSYDGFRKVLETEFNAIYVLDMKGNARTSGERRRREGGNVFNDQIRVGVAIYFLVRKKGARGCQIHYAAVGDYARSAEKLAYLREHRFEQVPFRHIQPDAGHNWLNQSENAWDELLPVAVRSLRVTDQESRLFYLGSPGIVTARDEWVVNLDSKVLGQTSQHMVATYAARPTDAEVYDTAVKWSRNLKARARRGDTEAYDAGKIRRYSYRPFNLHFCYDSDLFLDEKGASDETFAARNQAIAYTAPGSSKAFHCLASAHPVDFHLAGDTQYVARHRYDRDGVRYDNITDWALAQFQERYGNELTACGDTSARKDAIFAYVYAVLHDPIYRERYALNLKREFPRIPLYPGFAQWVAWGQRLLDLHLRYESVEPCEVERIDLAAGGATPKPRLKGDASTGTIEIDSVTTLRGVPRAAWDYRLGNRAALEWVLEYHKERKPRDPTIRERFDTYRLADYKEQVIDLLRRVVTVSVETAQIVQAMAEVQER